MVPEVSMQIRRFFSLAKLSVQSWLDDYAPSMGAAIAFYTVFSLAPLVMIVIGVAGFFWGEDAVRGELLRQAPWSWCSSGFTTPHKFSCWEPNSLGSMPMSTVRERKKYAARVTQ